MAAGNSISSIFAFIRQAGEQYQPTVTAYEENQRSHKALAAQAQQAHAEAEKMLDYCAGLRQQRESEQRRADQLKARRQLLAHRDSDDKQNSRNEEEWLSSQLTQCLDRIAALDQNILSGQQYAARLEGQAQQSEQRAGQLQGVMDNTRGKCDKIAEHLDNHADALKNEADLVRKQAQQFSSLTSNRFGASGANAAAQRQAYAANLDSISENTSELAQQYRLLADNLGNWTMTKGGHDINDSLSSANPNFSEDSFAWNSNCQRCVPTYELRRRGYNVTAEPILSGDDHLAYNPFDVWKNPDVQSCSGSGLSDIQSAMRSWGDGARAQVVVYWDNGQGGHTFAAEQINGTTCFIDPQTNEVYDAQWVFSNVEHGATSFCRIDHLRPSDWILKCCREA